MAKQGPHHACVLRPAEGCLTHALLHTLGLITLRRVERALVVRGTFVKEAKYRKSWFAWTSDRVSGKRSSEGLMLSGQKSCTIMN